MSKTKLFVALDFPEQKAAWDFFQKTKAVNPCFKVGLELFAVAGPSFVRDLANAGAEVFLDLKFHDIPNTVEGAVRAATRLNVAYMNVHCAGGKAMMRA